MSFFEAKKPEHTPALMVSFAEWESVYIKWDDDRGRGFDNVTRFYPGDDWIEITYTHPEAGEVKIKIRNHGIRWIEFYETKVEDGQE